MAVSNSRLTSTRSSVANPVVSTIRPVAAIVVVSSLNQVMDPISSPISRSTPTAVGVRPNELPTSQAINTPSTAETTCRAPRENVRYTVACTTNNADHGARNACGRPKTSFARIQAATAATTVLTSWMKSVHATGSRSRCHAPSRRRDKIPPMKSDSSRHFGTLRFRPRNHGRPGGRARRDHHPAGGRARRAHSESRRSTYPNRDSRSHGGVCPRTGTFTYGFGGRAVISTGSITRPPARSPERRLDHPNADSITRTSGRSPGASGQAQRPFSAAFLADVAESEGRGLDEGLAVLLGEADGFAPVAAVVMSSANCLPTGRSLRTRYHSRCADAAH